MVLGFEDLFAANTRRLDTSMKILKPLQKPPTPWPTMVVSNVALLGILRMSVWSWETKQEIIRDVEHSWSGLKKTDEICTSLHVHYSLIASILFNASTDRSFTPAEIRPLIHITPTTSDRKYTVELVDGELRKTSIILQKPPLPLKGRKLYHQSTTCETRKL